MVVLVIKSYIPGHRLLVCCIILSIPLVELHDFSWSPPYFRECLVFCTWNLHVILCQLCSEDLKGVVIREFKLFSTCPWCLWLNGICWSLFPDLYTRCSYGLDESGTLTCASLLQCVMILQWPFLPPNVCGYCACFQWSLLFWIKGRLWK